jgi:hypothetical protein
MSPKRKYHMEDLTADDPSWQWRDAKCGDVACRRLQSTANMTYSRPINATGHIFRKFRRLNCW